MLGHVFGNYALKVMSVQAEAGVVLAEGSRFDFLSAGSIPVINERRNNGSSKVATMFCLTPQLTSLPGLFIAAPGGPGRDARVRRS